MKRFILFISIVTAATLAGCAGKKDANGSVTDKKTLLAKLKAENAKNTDEIKKLEDELLTTDSATANAAKIKLVAATPVAVGDFKHFIDLEGKVDAQNISYIAPRGQGGQVQAVYVQQGQAVKKGQLLLHLDDAVMRQQVVAARQQLAGIRTQLAFAQNIYNRQKNLWDQGIGTEVQLISDRTNVEAYQNQLAAANENVKTMQEQLNTANVYSDVSGIADIVNIRVGETFVGMTAAGPQIKIVNTSSLKVVTSVPENYASVVHSGSPAEVTITDLNKVIPASISLLSQSVDPTNRGFVAEIKVPFDPQLRPNQAAKVRILDYENAKTIIIPLNTIQSDETGKYVYVLAKSGNGKTTAQKNTIHLGRVYGNSAEVLAGLSTDDQLITEGYQDLYEGQGVATATK